ncbi:MAG: Hsp20/alpha crystallin family protein [Acidobacteria bacterium]|nr:Hsp20/alpha crystallin family protein [Acidobacteriota bacterium]
MAIVRVDPFREFATLQDRVNRLFGNVYLRDEDVNGPSPWTPPVDIYETDGRDLIIKAEIPDLTKEAIEVTVANDTLTLRGERKRPADVKDEQFRRVERQYGTFSRSFSLPTTVDATKVSADYKNGVLTVKLPFREDAKPRTVTVNIAA